MKKYQCKGCLNRQPGCHDTCEIYNEIKREREEIKTKKHDERDKTSVKLEGIARMKKAMCSNGIVRNKGSKKYEKSN